MYSLYIKLIIKKAMHSINKKNMKNYNLQKKIFPINKRKHYKNFSNPNQL